MDKDMAQIPYVAHLARMYKAHKREERLKIREKRLKIMLVVTNVLWGILFLVTR
jgi:predicted GIY-YIG superfamily endonuclease